MTESQYLPPSGPTPPPHYHGYAPPPPTNTLAVLALVFGIVGGLPAIPLGHVARSQIRRTGEQGSGMALAGLILGYMWLAGLILSVVLFFGFIAWINNSVDDVSSSRTFGNDFATSATVPTPALADVGALPAGRADPFPKLVNCTYTPGGRPAKSNIPPRENGIDTTFATVSASMETTQGPIGITLNNSDSPCTVNSFASLAQQGYFDGTTCHRLTIDDSLKVLQCGDPTGTGTGGPGYQFANEFPTDQYAPDDLAAQTPVTYKRGTLAMANAGAGTNGSQFFLVYGDSTLPPEYTVFGTIDEAGLATIDKIAAAGAADGSADGKPSTPVEITSMRLG